jgi:hypothetical protein
VLKKHIKSYGHVPLQTGAIVFLELWYVGKDLESCSQVPLQPGASGMVVNDSAEKLFGAVSCSSLRQRDGLIPRKSGEVLLRV